MTHMPSYGLHSFVDGKIMNRPYPEHEGDSDLISRVLETLKLVDTPPEEEFDKFTRLAKRMMDVPVALVSFVQEARDRQFFKSQVGLTGKWAELRQTPLSHSFCQHVQRQNRPLVVEAAPKHALVCDNLAIAELGVQAYLGVPVHGRRGMALGALAVVDGVERQWRKEDVEAMTDLAACVTDQIKLRDALTWASST